MQVTWVQLQTKTFYLQGRVASLVRARKRTDVFSLPGLCLNPELFILLERLKLRAKLIYPGED